MEPLAFLRRTLIGLVGSLAAITLLVAVARANELPSGDAACGFVIHDASETLRDYCSVDESGVIWFQIPGGARWELISSVSDPAIANPGDGAFHPYDAAEVRAALASVRYPLERVGAEIFVLPYPRRAGLESAAGPGLILLAPGVEPLTPEHQHAEMIHELGHVVQYALMPDADAAGWSEYRRMRGIQDASVYNASSPHADRPHDIFAEDFRATFGDPLATYSNSVENAALTPPAQVAGLTEFMSGLAGPSLQLAAAPNPSPGPTQFSRAGVTSAPLDLFDLSGRRIAQVQPTGFSGGTAWIWDGHDVSGQRSRPGVLFARVRGERGPATRLTLTPYAVAR
jgi:hypothetical protein